MAGDEIRVPSPAELRAASDHWAYAAELLERRADDLGVGLRAATWDSPAALGYVERVEAVVARVRALADVARYNHRQLAAVSEVTADVAAGPVVGAVERLDDAYANAAARLTTPPPWVDGASVWPASVPAVPARHAAVPSIVLSGASASPVASSPVAASAGGPDDGRESDHDGDTGASLSDLVSAAGELLGDGPELVELLAPPAAARSAPAGPTGGYFTTPATAVPPVLGGATSPGPVTPVEPVLPVAPPFGVARPVPAVPVVAALNGPRGQEHRDRPRHHVTIRWADPDEDPPPPGS